MLQRWIDSQRVVKIEDYGPRWRSQFVHIGSHSDLDAELRDWLQESHDSVGLLADLK